MSTVLSPFGSAPIEFTEFVCAPPAGSAGGSCISAIVYRGSTYEVSCAQRLDERAVDSETLARGMWAKRRTEVRRISGIDLGIAVALQNPGAGCAAVGTWLVAVSLQSVDRTAWARWFSCSDGLVVGTTDRCGSPPTTR